MSWILPFVPYNNPYGWPEPKPRKDIIPDLPTLPPLPPYTNPEKDLIEEYKERLKRMEYIYVKPPNKDYKVTGNLILVPVPGCKATDVNVEHKDQSLVVSYKSNISGFCSNVVVIKDDIIKNTLISAKVKNGLLVMEFYIAQNIKIEVKDE